LESKKRGTTMLGGLLKILEKVMKNILERRVLHLPVHFTLYTVKKNIAGLT